MVLALGLCVRAERPNIIFLFSDDQTALAADGFFVVRCRHTFGHTIVSRALDIAKLWLYANDYGEPSPYQETGIDDWSDWCEIVE